MRWETGRKYLDNSGVEAGFLARGFFRQAVEKRPERLNLRLTDHGTGSCFEIPTAADVNFQFFLFLSLCNTQTLSFPVTRALSLSLSLSLSQG